MVCRRPYGLICFTWFLLHGCSNPMEQVNLFNRQQLPDQTIYNAHVIRSERGNLQAILDAPQIQKYMEPESKTVYPQGVKMTLYGSNREKTAFVYARRATSYDAQNKMHARDSVVIIDYRSHDTTYLQDLIWDSQQQRIYSDHPIKSKNGQRVTYGDSFESDDNFQHPQIIHQRGVIEFNDSI
ncbi:MAG: LPS export ABC transporter periplasmic protein LptC [Bacteroidales bacterium]|nr:LPS export ABC transporter periplasmic protein LptC [Candidatus Colimorpha onthohippi]